MTRKTRSLPAVALATLAFAAAGTAPSAVAADEAPATDPGLVLSPAVVHVKNGKIAMKATRAADASEASGVILGRLPLKPKPGSMLDPGGLGGPFFAMQPGQTIPVVFKLTPKTKAFLKTRRRTTLTVTIKLQDANRTSFETTKKVAVYAS